MNIEKSKSSLIFDKETKAGEIIKLKSKDKCYCIFAAPGEKMMVHEQNPSTELTVIVKRSVIKKDKEFSLIPDPIYDPSNEINIARTTANSYQVKEGDYIQVITPTGRQCSDFVAYDTSKLDKGKENGLDWQTTRTCLLYTSPSPRD